MIARRNGLKKHLTGLSILMAHVSAVLFSMFFGCFAPALPTSSALPADQSTVAGIFRRGGPECIDVLSPLNANSRTDHGEEIASATGDLKLPLRLPKTRVCSALV